MVAQIRRILGFGGVALGPPWANPRYVPDLPCVTKALFNKVCDTNLTKTPYTDPAPLTD